ncbi:MAG: HAMP domain-containing histidine kinase [Alphaproteobacteria bacterium]|nr:HAMP domain-containing histidine kinase [Alphaproteobacteria bacterium]
MNEKEVQLLDELKGLRKDFRAFCSRISSDLHGSLRNIGGFVSLIEGHSTIEFDDKVKRYLSFVKEGAEKAETLIGALTEYSGLLTEDKKLTTISLEEPLNLALSDIGPLLRERHGFVQTKLCPVEIFGDVGLLRKAFGYILDNAIIYSRTAPHIDIKFEKKNAMYLISISDNGIGIPDDYHQKVFEPFERLHPAEYFSGIGLGLSIVKRIINLHRGRIWIENNEIGYGTTVFIVFPLRA